ncbi:hypothetical protein ACIQUF_20110 [Pseudomonas sp. NPDC090233]|uniref:hypothetical protein n=1 Tax=Pseudomonas sp. NPDC090233 TaxID=3364479 RepID=UPI00383A8ACC
MSINAENVHAHLKKALNLDPYKVHVTEVADVIEFRVVRSNSLVQESLHWLKRKEEPTYDQGLVGMFHAPGTFDPAHRVAGLRLSTLEREIGRMLSSLG